jgi:hypothetical protein
MAHNRTLRVAKLVKFGQKTKFILILLDNYSVQMYRFRAALNQFIVPIIWLLLLGICLLAPFYPEELESYYTKGLFKYWTICLRYLLGWIPFAIGEFIYIILIIVLIINIVWQFNSIKKFSHLRQKIGYLLLQFSWLGLRLFVVFQLIWGLNYLKPDPSYAFQLKTQTPKNAEVALEEMNILTYELIQELNQTRAALNNISAKSFQFEQIKTRVELAYGKLTNQNQHFQISYPSLKKAVFPTWGDYIGYLAFYQPLTGEAIVRADLPIWTQPYTIAHEMAHQMGYASETEANFIAYVAAAESGDPILRYSMLLQMFTYAQDAQLLLLAGTKGYDSWKAQIAKNKALLSPAVLKDRLAIRAFFSARAGKQIEASTQLYDQFLKWNQQAAGLASYADVLKWVRAYRLKTGSSTSYSR